MKKSTGRKSITTYWVVAAIYLIALVSSSLANYWSGNVQAFYRVPILNIRWIDVSILIVIADYFYKLTSRSFKLKNTGLLQFLCFTYLIFESFQFYRTWGVEDPSAQLSHFLCTLALFIIIDLSTFSLPLQKIITFLEQFTIWGAAVILISNLYLLYSFVSGNIVFEDLGIRVALDVLGSKETVYPFVLTPFVYAFGLFFIQRPGSLFKKILFIGAILSIFASMVITFERGTLVTIVIITLYFIMSSAKVPQMLLKISVITLLIVFCYLIFGDILASKGYDPIKKIVQIAEFSTDVKNPDWDKGRSISQSYALKAWGKNFWFGAGYDNLYHYGLPEDVATAHNGVITSLFQRGVIGTIILMTILILLFKNAISLWVIIPRGDNYEDNMIKLLILVSLVWIIIFMTQEALWEKYSLSVQFIYLGFITNCYKQVRKICYHNTA